MDFNDNLLAAAETYSLEKTQVAHLVKVLKDFNWNITKEWGQYQYQNETAGYYEDNGPPIKYFQ